MLGEIAASGAGTSGASPIHFSMFPPMPIIKYGSEEMKRRHLPKIARGDMKLAFSVTEPNVGQRYHPDSRPLRCATATPG